MPKGNKQTVKIELEEDEGTVELEFLPLGPTGIVKILRDKTDDYNVENISKMDTDINTVLRTYAPVYADLIFNELLEKCVSHKIVNPEKASKEEREEADYWTSDFTLQEQVRIVKAVQGQEKVKEAMEDAETFQGDNTIDSTVR